MNVSIIYSSLKYLSKNYESLGSISKWFYSELEKYNYQGTKFIKSLKRKDFEIIKTLIKFNKNIGLISEYLYDFCFSKNNHFDIVKLLIDNGADIHIRNNRALMLACDCGHFNIVKLLIDNEADIYARNNQAIRLASSGGYLDIIKLFINNGVNIDDSKALIHATWYGKFEVVKFFVENGADIHINNNEALILARMCGYNNIVKFLTDNGAKNS